MPDIVPTPRVEALARQTWLAHVGDQASFNRDLAKILADAAKEGEQIILNTIGDGVGAEIRRAQYKIAVAQLQQLSAQMWGGQIDPLITQHIALSTDRAVDGLMSIDRVLASSLANPVLREGFLAAARNGADNVRSRLLNNIRLSPQVYQTQALANQWVSQEVNRGIALNKSAKEIANSVRKFIRPDVRGGVSYAAQRLGRTELNNAFHTTTIRAAADQPWVTGFLWHTSGSHPEPDECDQFADQDHDGLGPGVFAKGNAPGKPHPQCLCYITTIDVSDEEFEHSLISGKYDSYLGDNGQDISAQFKFGTENSAAQDRLMSRLYASPRSSLPSNVSDAIDQYERQGQSMNSMLRGKRDMTPEVRSHVIGLDEAFANHSIVLDEDVISTRVVGRRDMESIFNDIGTGGEFIDQGFVSTALSPSQLSEIEMKYSMQVNILLPSGSKVVPVDSFYREALLPRGSKFKIRSIGDGVVNMELL